MRFLLLLLLVGCAHRPFTESGSLTKESPCRIIEDKQICLDSATIEDKVFHAYEVSEKPILDEREKAAIRACKWGGAADNATTFIALQFCNAVELNPLFASMSPVGVLVVNGLLSYAACEYFENKAEQSPLMHSTANNIFLYSYVRFGAATWNAGQLTSCL